MKGSGTQVEPHRYVSGWCEAAWHERCKGSYAGTECACSCHRQVEAERCVGADHVADVSARVTGQPGGREGS